MAYIDLNPIRANIAKTPESSDYTSIKERIKPCFQLDTAVEEQIELGALRYFNVPLKPLSQFEGAVKNQYQKGILFSLSDYLELIDYTGFCSCKTGIHYVHVNNRQSHLTQQTRCHPNKHPTHSTTTLFRP